LGASIYLIGRRLNRLELVATKARALGVDAAFCLADISPSSGLLGATQRIKAELRHVDILVQNAAIYAAGSIEDADLSDFSRAQRLSWANGERDEWF
jgi:NADP-dependent 3-hydroxy acid dehydrogenase YdfG